MQCEGHTNSLGEERPVAEVQVTALWGRDQWSGNRRSTEVRKRRDIVQGRWRVRQPVPKIQPTGHPRPPKGKGNRCTWEGKKRKTKESCSYQQTSHLTVGKYTPECCPQTRRLRVTSMMGAGAHCGAYHLYSSACLWRLGRECTELKLKSREGKVNTTSFIKLKDNKTKKPIWSLNE